MRPLPYIIGLTLLALLALGAWLIFSSKAMPDDYIPTQLDLNVAYRATLSARLAAATSTAQEAQIQRWLAMLEMRLGHTGDGYALLRDVSETPRYPASERALAVQSMWEIFLNRSGRTSVFARSYLFSAAPYDGMVVSRGDGLDGRELRNGLYRLYTHAGAIADLPTIEYRLAEWHAQDATENPLSRETSISHAKHYFERGNVLLPTFAAALPEEDNYMEGQALRLKALVAMKLARLTEERSYGDVAVQSFDAARASLLRAMDTQVRAPAIELLWADLHYAQFLASRPATDDRTVRIRALLSEILQYKGYGNGFVQQLRQLDARDFSLESIERTKQGVVSLMGYDATFDAFLESLGWEVENLLKKPA